MSARDERVERLAEALYVVQEWSGCDGASWQRFTDLPVADRYREHASRLLGGEVGEMIEDAKREFMESGDMWLAAQAHIDKRLAALADDPARAEAAEANYELAFYRANEACSVREEALARVEALAEKFETWPDVGDAFGPRWIGQQLRVVVAGGPTEGSEQ